MPFHCHFVLAISNAMPLPYNLGMGNFGGTEIHCQLDTKMDFSATLLERIYRTWYGTEFHCHCFCILIMVMETIAN